MMQKRLLIFILVLASALLISCSKNKKNETEETVTTTAATTVVTEEPVPDILPKAKELLAQNPDTVGWIKISNTNIDYPVLQIKDEKTGNDFYLSHGFDKKKARDGAIFMDYRAVFGGKESEQSDNIVIYGHNSRYKVMFTKLHNYKKSIDFYKQNPIVELNSNYKTYKYKIFGYMITNVLEKDGEVFIYHRLHDFATEADFNAYVNGVKKRSLIISDIDVKYGDKLLTLSTCSTEFDESRFVVVARRLRDGEDPKADISTAKLNPDPLYPDIWYRKFGGSYKGN